MDDLLNDWSSCLHYGVNNLDLMKFYRYLFPSAIHLFLYERIINRSKLIDGDLDTFAIKEKWNQFIWP